MSGNGSVVRRRVLGRELRRLRERAGFTLETAAPRLEFSVSESNRIEVGQQATDVHRTADQLADESAVRTIRQRRLTSTKDPIVLDAVISATSANPTSPTSSIRWDRC